MNEHPVRDHPAVFALTWVVAMLVRLVLSSYTIALRLAVVAFGLAVVWSMMRI